MTLPKLRSLAKGALSFVVPSLRTVHGYDNPIGTLNAESCYSIFTRHLALLRQCGVTAVPRAVAELGPGSSIGVGMAALLAGAQRYYALDVVDFTDAQTNLRVLDELVELFLRQVPIPASGIHSRRFPDLDNYQLPLDCVVMVDMVRQRTEAIRRDLVDRHCEMIQVAAPWTEQAVPESIDWIISQSVLEHVDDLNGAYRAMASWLRPGGYASHLIDFSSHGLTREWNGHWAVDDRTWAILRGRRPYLLNRAPYAQHKSLAADYGFAPLMERRSKRFDGLIPSDFVAPFDGMSDEDARAAMVFVVQRKG
jgi:SAM-dependent methyltransferase